MIQPQHVYYGSPSLEPRRVSIFANLGIEPRPVYANTAFCRATVASVTTLLLIGVIWDLEDLNLAPKDYESSALTE